MTYLLGLDLGTSSVKTLLVEENGQIAGRGSAEYPIQAPQPGQAEQNPDEWWQACQVALRQALAEAESPVQGAGEHGAGRRRTPDRADRQPCRHRIPGCQPTLVSARTAGNMAAGQAGAAAQRLFTVGADRRGRPRGRGGAR